MPIPLARRVLPLLVLLLALVPAVGATWSIVVVDRRTGEVCVASATCIPRVDLTAWTPVILVGRGGGVTQALLDDGSNKVRILEGLLAGDTPQAIMQRIRDEDDGFRSRQIGIVDFVNAPLSFTGGQAGRAKLSLTGEVDDLVYAVQGNVMVSQAVIEACAIGLRESRGDLAQRVLAGMVRTRQLGGDGRCSCGIGSLGDCGQPEPGFEKSAHIGYLIVARMGDTDGACAVGASCVQGDYHLRLSIHGPDALPGSPDPIDQLVERHADWRAARIGRPDGLLSFAVGPDSLPADGTSERTITVQLVDLEGNTLTTGGATLEVAGADGAPLHVTPGPVSDHGNGKYSFPVRAGSEPGLDRLAIVARDDLVRATLYPYLELRSDPPAALHAGLDRLSASAPRAVPFVVSVPERPQARYWLLARANGAARPLLRGLLAPASPFFPASPGALDGAGRAEASLELPPASLHTLVGLRLEWTALVLGPGRPTTTNQVALQVVP
ncbi:MAG TPA: DUF1028 domain-containing protein [Planctomycetota bacterium]